MAIPSRHSSRLDVIAGQRTFFVTSSIWGKRALLQSDRSATLFRTVLYEYRCQGKYRLHEFVIMPDHFHALTTVSFGTTVERAVQFIKGGFSFRAGRELGFSSPVWQKGFSESRVTDAKQYAAIRNYIRENPVRRGLVERAEDYSFSSAFPGAETDLCPLFLSRSA